MNDIDAVLFDFSDVVGRIRMALAGEPGEGPYRIELIDTVVAAVRDLKASGIRTALVTNNDRDAFSRRAPEIDLDEIFDVVVFSSDVGVSKPGFAIYVHALKKLGVDAHRSLFMDDLARNVDAAIALGMTGVVVESSESVLSAINAVITSNIRRNE